MPKVPAHMNDVEGGFCPGGEKEQESGRCQYGCDHADHYANDGHPGCDEDQLDLPAGYRWASEEETEAILADPSIEHLVVPRSKDSTGKPYTQDEADVAVKITEETDA